MTIFLNRCPDIDTVIWRLTVPLIFPFGTFPSVLPYLQQKNRPCQQKCKVKCFVQGMWRIFQSWCYTMVVVVKLSCLRLDLCLLCHSISTYERCSLLPSSSLPFFDPCLHFIGTMMLLPFCMSYDLIGNFKKLGKLTSYLTEL